MAGPDLSEWSERKGDNLYQLANYYEKRVLKLKHLLVEPNETSGELLTVNKIGKTWWLLVLLFTGFFEKPFAPLLLIVGVRLCEVELVEGLQLCIRLRTLLFRAAAGCCAMFRLCGVWTAFWN